MPRAEAFWFSGTHRLEVSVEEYCEYDGGDGNGDLAGDMKW